MYNKLASQQMSIFMEEHDEEMGRLQLTITFTEMLGCANVLYCGIQNHFVGN